MSFIRKIVPGRIRLPGDHSSELPMYHAEASPPAFPPAAVNTASILIERSSGERKRTDATSRQNRALQSESLTMLHRRERQLELDLQQLLDRQGEALMSGPPTHQSNEEQHRAGAPSSAPSDMHFLQANPPSPNIKQPPNASPSAARRGIYKAIRELAGIKGREAEIIAGQVRQLRAVQKQLDAWERKRARLQHEIDALQSHNTRSTSENLQREADTLLDEITQAEQALLRMKQQHQSITNQISDINNSKQSKLSSYTTSLETLDEDVQRYLRSTLVQGSISQSETKELSFIPAERHNLHMAREAVAAQSLTLDALSQAAQAERTALDDGSKLWKTCVLRIETFEEQLRQGLMAGQDSISSQKVRLVLSSIDKTIQLVRDDLQTATSSNWTLLVACISAELYAFEQGQLMLQRIVDTDDQHPWQDASAMNVHSRGLVGEPDVVWHSSHMPLEQIPVKDDEDDAPDPELMFSPFIKDDMH